MKSMSQSNVSKSFHPHYYICLFVFCLEFIVPFENVSLIWRCHHYQGKAANVDLCSHSWPYNLQPGV